MLFVNQSYYKASIKMTLSTKFGNKIDTAIQSININIKENIMLSHIKIIIII
jgi:hypothetical protein